MPKRYTCVKKLLLLTFGSVNYASTTGRCAAVTKGLRHNHSGQPPSEGPHDSAARYRLTVGGTQQPQQFVAGGDIV